MLSRLLFVLRLSHAHRIARRYFVTNGFDGALTIMGLIMGFYTTDNEDLSIVISACLGAAIALAVSGISSAYLSESAERQRELKKLEQAVARDLDDTAQAEAALKVPFIIGAVNGLAPLLMALIIMLPLWWGYAGLELPLPALEAALIVALVVLFSLGAFIGSISGRFWLWSGLKMLGIAVITASIIWLLEV